MRAPTDARGVLPVDAHQEQVARVPLDQRRDVRVPRSSDQVPLPMARRSSSLDLGRPIPDPDGVDDLAAPLPLGAATLSASHCPSAPQTCDEFPLEHSARLQIKATVDRLVRNPNCGAAPCRSEPTGDLLRRPVLLQLLGNELAELLVLRQKAGLWPLRSNPGSVIGERGTVL